MKKTDNGKVSFGARIPAELARRTKSIAASKGVKLAAWLARALERELKAAK